MSPIYEKKKVSESAIKKIDKKVNSLARKMDGEYKFFDTLASITASQFNSTGVVYSTSIMAQGATNTTRNGNSIKIDRLEFRIQPLLGALPTAIRILVFMDKAYNGSLPAVTDVLSIADVRSSYNFNTSRRFTIISDTFEMLNSLNTKVSFVKTVKNNAKRQVKYLGTSNTSADGGNNQICVLLLSEVATANAPTCIVYSRIIYEDN